MEWDPLRVLLNVGRETHYGGRQAKMGAGRLARDKGRVKLKATSRETWEQVNSQSKIRYESPHTPHLQPLVGGLCCLHRGSWDAGVEIQQGLGRILREAQ